MSYGLKQLAPPAEEPIALDEAMRHLKEFDPEAGPYINDVLIPSARQRAEADTGRQLISAPWQLTLPRFPCGTIALPKGVVQSVEEVTYVDQAGDEQLLAPESYRLLADREPAEVEPVDYWPGTHPRRRDAVRVKFTPGYGPAGGDVPALLRSGMLMAMGHWYANREEVVTGTIATAVPESAKDIFARFRVGDDFINYAEGS